MATNPTDNQVDEMFPLGAIENGRAFISRLDNDCHDEEAWEGLKFCLEYMADYLATIREKLGDAAIKAIMDGVAAVIPMEHCGHELTDVIYTRSAPLGNGFSSRGVSLQKVRLDKPTSERR